MDKVETLGLLALAAQYDATMMPTETSDQRLKAEAWAGMLAGVDSVAALRAVTAHYRDNDKSITVARIRHAALNASAADRRKQRQLSRHEDSTHPPPVDLLDRSNICPTCHAASGDVCTPRMPFGISHLHRSPVAVAKYEQHAEFERMVNAGRLGLVCECCGETTDYPASTLA